LSAYAVPQRTSRVTEFDQDGAMETKKLEGYC